jgi:hypothetical protein
MCRFLHQNIATKEQNGPSEVKEFLQCVQMHMLRLNATVVVRRGTQSNVGPVSPRLALLPQPALGVHRFELCAVAVICGQTWSARSNAKTSVRSNAWPAFERRPVTC